LVIAHRTCPRDTPENSIGGIEWAAVHGADAVEIDVRLARDGVPILHHDPYLFRMTSVPWPVRWMSSTRARKLRLQRTTQRLPSLADALDALPPHLSVAIDVKDRRAGPAVLDEIRRRGMADRVLFWSQHEAVVRAGAASGLPVEVALLRDTAGPDEHARLLDDALAFGAGAISAHWAVVNLEFVAAAHRRGLRVYSWCQERGAARDKVDLPLDGIVTDWPQDVRALLT
jgi:glycerophosphoryl diester phosphodiesterase